MSAGYAHDGQQRILRLVLLLAGHEIDGLAPGDIAKQQDCLPSAVTRDLYNLRQAGFAEQLPDSSKRWRLTPMVIQMSRKHAVALERARQVLGDIDNRYSRS